MKTFADLMLLSLAEGPVFAASSPFHRQPWAIYNRFEQDLPAAVLRGEGLPSQSRRG